MRLSVDVGVAELALIAQRQVRLVLAQLSSLLGHDPSLEFVSSPVASRESGKFH